ncbi:MAG: carbamoyltransferase [Planctomycetes bacterium]|nr:carbamoyltransferase [Planctomycetota bacterium]
MLILGINAFHPDASCCVLRDGELVAAAEEERFNRKKHCAGFPTRALRYCLEEARASIEDVEIIAFPKDVRANFWRRLETLVRYPRRALRTLVDRSANALKVVDVRGHVARALECDPARVKAEIVHVEHHLAHLSSAFFASGFERAACVSIDAFGDFASTMWGIGEGNRIRVLDRILFPHSLGIFYTAVCQWLGFPKFGDEGKVMALASFAQPTRLEEMKRLATTNPRTGEFRLGLPYFLHHDEGVAMTWGEETPRLGPMCSTRMTHLLGAARAPSEPLEAAHKEVAASLQKRLEACVMELLRRRLASQKDLCVAGGVAYNCVLNGRIADEAGFERLFVQPAAGDSGAALGAALFAHHQLLGRPRRLHMRHAAYGPGFSEQQILRAIGGAGLRARRSSNVAAETAREVAAGKIVGWFQGRMEFGPRALGHRSIVADPRRADMKEQLNRRVKHREPFRPFAPSVLAERASEYFQRASDTPFMIVNDRFRPSRAAEVPAVVHVDGTGRLQSVRREANPRYWELIEAFRRETGVPMLLNTSFNENEPIVCTPEDAIRCFKGTPMDVLVLGDWILERHEPVDVRRPADACVGALLDQDPA